MTRRASVLIAALGLGSAVAAALVGGASAAYAADVTNPAQHPAPVTITIDGQTYHDGLDTLPGYDDYACTAIPNVQYDFAGNEIDYYDDDGNLKDSAHWTEWARITSYQTWLNQQAAASSSGAAPSPTAPHSTSAAPAAGSSASAATSSTPKSSRSSSSHVSSVKKSASASSENSAAERTPSRSVSVGGVAVIASSAASSAAPSDHPSAASKGAAAAHSGSDPSSTPASAPEEATTAAQVSSQPSAALAGQSLAAAVTSSIGSGAGDTRLAGLGILAVLAAVGICLLLGNFVSRQTFKRRMTGTHS